MKISPAPFPLVMSFLMAMWLCACNHQPTPPIRPDSTIEISISGGGIYGGINPTTEKKTTINNAGEVIVSQGALYTGNQSKKLHVPPTAVADLAREIASLGFFGMAPTYDCAAGDKACENRKTGYPPSVPLTLEVRIDDYHHGVQVTVFEKGTVDYPRNLDRIVEMIEQLARQAHP